MKLEDECKGEKRAVKREGEKRAVKLKNKECEGEKCVVKRKDEKCEGEKHEGVTHKDKLGKKHMGVKL